MSEAFDWKKVLDQEEKAAVDSAAPPVEEPVEAPPVEIPKVEEPTETVPEVEGEADEDGRDMTYRPAAIPTNIYEINVGKGKYSAGLESTPSHHVRMEGHPTVDNFHLDEILRMAFERKASDVHLTVGLPPMVRMDGELMPLPYQPLGAQDTRRLIFDCLSDDNVHKLEKTHELDFGYGVKDVGRFRFNVYMQRGSYAGALRSIPTKIPSFEELCLPPIIREMAKRASGLILVTGPTGSGKSTTIASMIDDINQNRTTHIMTIEDPIEYLHTHKKSMINQRELHADTYSFHAALRAVLREDPDIILVGELRDLETIEAGLTLAETGHLVFGTLHTRNAPATIDRIVDVFPPDQQAQIRVLLGNTLEGVVSQQLLPRLGGGRRAALEVMIGNPAIKNLIREGKTHQMYSIIETSSNIGMQTMDRSLSDLFKNGYCSHEECLIRAVDKETFQRMAKA
jgi:twitching motility protein PilT